jgi:hypothetical protein
MAAAVSTVRCGLTCQWGDPVNGSRQNLITRLEERTMSRLGGRTAVFFVLTLSVGLWAMVWGIVIAVLNLIGDVNPF